MMSQALSPTVMASIARMVAQQLQQNGVVNQFASRPSFLGPEPNAIAGLAPNASSQGQMLQIEDAPRISRSMSSASTTSSFSASPGFGDLEDEEDCQIVGPPSPLPDPLADMRLDYACFSGKNKKSKFLPEDKIVVNDPIMKVLDPLFLAPFESDLFKRERVKVPDANGFRRLKKHADIVLGLFKTLTKSTLRRLLRAAREKSPDLRQRYFYAALAVTTKRRANHIQSWRVNGRPLNFCYGGKEIYIAKYGPIGGKNVKTEKLKVAKTSETPGVEKAFAMTADFSDTEEFADEQMIHVDLKCIICNDVISVTSVTGKKPPSSKKFTCIVCLEGGKSKCAGCGKFFAKDLMFPKCDQEFKVTKKESTLRCNFCWQTLVKSRILPEMNERCEKMQKQQGKNPGTEIKKCKCGSTTHKTANSRMCPLNKRYNPQGT